MGTCCAAHLAAMVRDCALDAENKAVTVKTVEDSFERFIPGSGGGYVCKYCGAPAEFELSYHPKSK